jgi:glycine/D-amino acid oxidase-like deaminating enzyme
MGYGRDELYTRWSVRSLAAWQSFSVQAGHAFFHRTGVLWLVGKGDDGYTQQSQEMLEEIGVPHRRISVPELKVQYPEISTEDLEWALWEPDSGVLMARQSVQALVRLSVQRGLEFRIASVEPPAAQRRLERIVTRAGDTISGGAFIFTCGAWLPRMFPDVLRDRIFPTRQEVFFFAPPPRTTSFAHPSMPTWLHHAALVYGMPDLENRGVKISIDPHGPVFDPDSGLRLASAEGLATAHRYLAQRFPNLKDAPLSESRVCQYENTSNGDFLIDRHPGLEDVWIVGGGSGHGFKHGPAVGEYVKQALTTSVAREPRFSIATKSANKVRAVF